MCVNPNVQKPSFWLDELFTSPCAVTKDPFLPYWVLESQFKMYSSNKIMLKAYLRLWANLLDIDKGRFIRPIHTALRQPRQLHAPLLTEDRPTVITSLLYSWKRWLTVHSLSASADRSCIIQLLPSSVRPANQALKEGVALHIAI